MTGQRAASGLDRACAPDDQTPMKRSSLPWAFASCCASLMLFERAGNVKVLMESAYAEGDV
jgi:hypothetical protein